MACSSENCCGGACCPKNPSSTLEPGAQLLPKTPAKTKSGSSSDLWPTVTPSSTRSHRLSQAGELFNNEAPLATKCAVHTGPDGGVCCRDLKGDDERALVDPDIVRDVIIGLSDGLTVPFALTAGLSGLGNSRIVVLGGLAELIAGAISMGIGGFLATQAERDHFHYLSAQTHARVLRSCAGEMEREVHEILGSVGVDEGLSRLVAENLMSVETENSAAEDYETPKKNKSSLRSCLPWVGKKEKIGSSEEGQKLKWANTVGLTAFLLKFGEGMEEVETIRLYVSAFTIGMSYFLGGLCPLLPYFFVADVAHGLIWSSALTVLILLIFGAVKTHFTGAAGGFGGYVYGAVSTAIVGGVAAAAAFGIVRLLEV